MLVVLGITVVGYYKVQPLPLQTLPFAQPEMWHGTRRVSLLRLRAVFVAKPLIDMAACETMFGLCASAGRLGIFSDFIGWSDNHFNNLHFKKSQHINDCSAAHVAMLFVSSEIMKCRWLKRLLDHPMKIHPPAATHPARTPPPLPVQTATHLYNCVCVCVYIYIYIYIHTHHDMLLYN